MDLLPSLSTDSPPAPEASVKASLNRKSGTGLAVAAAILSAGCWGSATVMSKGILEYLPPLTLLVIQLTASITVLWVAVFVLRLKVRLDQRTRRASLSGLLEPGIAYTVGTAGLALTTASNATLIGSAEPLFVIILAWLVLRERIGSPMLGLALVVTCGIALVVLPDIRGGGAGSVLGDTLVTLGTLFGALYVIATRKLVLTLDPLPLSALQQSIGLLWTFAVIMVALAAGLATLGLNGVEPQVLLLAAVSGVVQYALAFWFYLFALRRLPANVTAFYLALIPVFGVGAAYGFLGESLSPVQWVGAALIIIAVAAVSRASRRSP